MRKIVEINTPSSCLNKAKDDEMLFILLGRDKAAPQAILYWCETRIRMGLNVKDDPQIKEAMRCALEMQHDQLAH